MALAPMPTAEIVDVKSLWQTIVFATIAAIGLTFIFSLGLYGFIRAEHFRDEDRLAAAIPFYVLAFLGLAGVLAALVLGLIVMTDK